MLFPAKTKGFLIEQGEQTTYIARVSSFNPPLVIEDLVEVPSGNLDAFSAALSNLKPKKKSGYLYANCGCNPSSKFIRRASLDLKRIKEPEYLTEILTTQFRVDPETHTVVVLNSADGVICDFAKPNPAKDVIFCGMPSDEIKSFQSVLLDQGIFPNRLEVSSLACIGAIIDYLKFIDSNKPTLVLELGAEQTQSYIVSARGLEASRPIAVGLDAMVPVVQKELGLKDEDSAKKLFFSNTFDFTGMGPALCKRLLKELQSSMGFYEVQTGQSIGQVICPVLPSKLAWLENVIAAQVGVTVFNIDFGPWLNARQISFGESITAGSFDARKLGLLGLGMNFNTHTSDAGSS